MKNENISYCEKITGKPFDWFEALEEARICEISEEFYNKLVSLASSWVTCACGNQCAIIPRRYRTVKALPGEPIERGTENAPPFDEELTDLGIRFSFNVEAKHWDRAIESLRKIEARSAVLIAELKK